MIEDKHYDFQNILTIAITKRCNLKDYIFKKLNDDNSDA